MKQARAWRLGLLVSCLWAMSLFAQRQQEVALVVYGEDLALVKEIRHVSIRKGEQTIALTGLSEKLDISSLSVRFPAQDAEVLEQSFQPAARTTDALLRRCLNDTVTVLLSRGDLVSGRLIALLSSDLLICKRDGSFALISGREIQQVQLAPRLENVSLRPQVYVRLDSRTSGEVPVEVSYLTTGLEWTASYSVFLSESDTELELNGWARLENNTGVSFADAELVLVAGEIARARTERPGPLRRAAGEMAIAVVPASPFEERALFEYHEYWLDRTVSIRDGESKLLRLIGPLRGRCRKIYEYDGQRNGEQVKVKVAAENTWTNGLGKPLPRGTVRVFRRSGNSLRLLGEDRITDVPVGNKLELNVGYAFDVRGERTLLASEQVGRNAREETVRIRLKNGKKEPVEVHVVEHLRGDWEIRKTTHTFEKVSAYEIRFAVSVPAESERSIEYTALIRY